MAQPFSEMQTAVVLALRGNTAVQQAMTGATAPTWNILDNVPVLTVFPYQYIADMQGQVGKASSIGPNGNATDIMLTIHIYSQYYGWKEVDAIVTANDNVLNRKSLALANGFTHFFSMFDNFIPIVEKDGKTRHGALRYKFMISGG